MDTRDIQHEDFVAVRQDGRHGGFEEVKHKDGLMSDLHFFRKAVTPFNHAEFDDMMNLQKCVLKDGCSGVVYPVYDHDGRKWVVMSVPHDHYQSTGLAA